MKKILVTAALPYANGPLHLGHLVEYIQADIFVRFKRLRSENCIFICGDDAHGTPIMISAQKYQITPEELIARAQADHEIDFKYFNVSFDHYYTTHSPENQELSNIIYNKLQAHGDITTAMVKQAYDPTRNMFLPDRFVKGDCPHCGATDQYGDNCEVCGATYSPSDLKNPISTLSGAIPIEKESLHYFFQLGHYQDMLRQWITENHVEQNIQRKLLEWFEAGLQPWDISRDEPYFGFEIPNAPGKYFYVWLDAPIGYMATFKNYCTQRPDLSFEEYWGKNSQTELYHFVGKDIIYFHALFWPAMLEGSDFRLPTKIFTHGFLTINGQKMSKSRGTFITARKYSMFLDSEPLRYYFAAKSTGNITDIDLNFEDFVHRINSDLVGKFVNIASRCAGFITKYFYHRLANQLHDQTLFNTFRKAKDKIARCYEELDFNQATREIMTLADLANQYIDEKKPWVLVKDPEKLLMAHLVCTQGINLFRQLIIYLKPILPETAIKSEVFLNIDPLKWQDVDSPLLDHQIEPFKPLMLRLEFDKISEMLQQEEEIFTAPSGQHS